MSAIDARKRAFRAITEQHLTVAAMEAMRAKYPDAGTRPPAFARNLFWRHVFVPLYRRIPWGVKRQVMLRAGMTARGWTPPRREPGTPWRPPPPG